MNLHSNHGESIIDKKEAAFISFTLCLDVSWRGTRLHSCLLQLVPRRTLSARGGLCNGALCSPSTEHTSNSFCARNYFFFLFMSFSICLFFSILFLFIILLTLQPHLHSCWKSSNSFQNYICSWKVVLIIHQKMLRTGPRKEEMRPDSGRDPIVQALLFSVVFIRNVNSLYP